MCHLDASDAPRSSERRLHSVARDAQRLAAAALMQAFPTARSAAERARMEIARSAGLRVGDVVSARAGVFQITKPYPTEVSSTGTDNTSKRRKEVTVTVNTNFALR